MPIYKDLVRKISIPPDKKTKQKDYLKRGSVAVIDQGQQLIGGYTNNDNMVVSCDLPVIVFGDHTRVVKYISFPFGAGADGIKVLQPKQSILPKFLYYSTQYLVLKLEDRGYARHYQYLEKKELNVPSISDQERIVARIEELFSELDNGVETLKKTKHQLAAYRQAVYSSVYKESDMRPIKDFFEVSGGLTKNSKRNELPLKKPYLRVANVYYNELDLSEIKYIGVNENEVQKTTLKKNDLLFVEGNGSKEQIGRVAIWDGSIENCLHQNHLIKGRPLGNTLSQYALFYLISAYGRKQILKVASSTSGLYTLSTNKVRNLQIPFVDIKKQQQCLSTIEERLSVCNSIEKTVDVALQQAEAMRQSILKKAFEGEL